MAKVTLSTELPIGAEVAAALARTPELVSFVLAPIVSLPKLDMPDRIEPGVAGSARIRWFGVIPAWRHHLRLVRLEPTEIYTNEWGGPVRTWNHRLTFDPIGDSRCRYTDEIETEDGAAGFVTRLFIRAMFPHRHRRWRQLASVLASGDVEFTPAPR